MSGFYIFAVLFLVKAKDEVLFSKDTILSGYVNIYVVQISAVGIVTCTHFH